MEGLKHPLPPPPRPPLGLSPPSTCCSPCYSPWGPQGVVTSREERAHGGGEGGRLPRDRSRHTAGFIPRQERAYGAGLTAQHEEQHAGQRGHDDQQREADALPHPGRRAPSGSGSGRRHHPRRGGKGEAAPLGSGRVRGAADKDHGCPRHRPRESAAATAVHGEGRGFGGVTRRAQHAGRGSFPAAYEGRGRSLRQTSPRAANCISQRALAERSR